jgi:hypothetical protein
MTSTPPPPDHGPAGYYPQQPYYAPGWQAPVPTDPAARGRRRTRILLGVGGVLTLALLVGLALGGRYLLATRPLGDVATARDATPRQLAVGHCIEELPDDGEVGRVRVVPCAEPHAAEVVGELALPAGPWPGQAEVDRRVIAWCEMDTAQRDAGFAPVVWAPGEAAWGQGDRRGLCLAWFDGGGVTGSFTAGDRVSTP